MKIVKLNINDIKEYDNNVKSHPDWQIEQIKNSIQQFGFNDPIVVDTNKVIIEGHGRYNAVKKLNYKEVECIVLDLKEELSSKYRLVHNKLNLNTGFNEELLNKELNYLLDNAFNLEYIGIDNYNFDEEEILELEESEEEYIIEKLSCPNCGYIGLKEEFDKV
ncbi:ParB/Srx family N-terminal domain-containing protein [Pseudostreptobacillus hongkongensis]|uniref:ParB/Srx family N-terminal domain-containing protein n=1 Tax=Pseudostreptobacillus hongkongensis TaxID=1162717 RepID=UPI00082D5D0E|nr:ParB/Srx family N-terminal domain-containing protein [Pseudostreptobacillus hongkongensis]